MESAAEASTFTLTAADWTWGDHYLRLRVWNNKFVFCEDATEMVCELEKLKEEMTIVGN